VEIAALSEAGDGTDGRMLELGTFVEDPGKDCVVGGPIRTDERIFPASSK